jgi:RHH-type transcriptional regulator, rel operon repressor / antitoxin RelB
MLSIRLPEELNARLDYLSEKTHRPKSFYVKEAIETYLEDMEDIFISLDRITAKDREFYTSDQMIAKLSAKKDV